MRALTLAIFLVTLVGMSGCQTTETSERFKAAQENVLSCQRAVMHYKQQMAVTPRVVFKDERNALTYLIVQELVQAKANDELDACDDSYIAMINSDSNKTAGLTRMGTSLGGIGLGLVGLGIITNGITDLANTGTSQGDTWTVNNSRVVSKGTTTGSGSISSSGEGMGIANTYGSGGSQAVGGLEPRTLPINGNVTEVNTGSLSGENAPISLPETPEVLPADLSL